MRQRLGLVGHPSPGDAAALELSSGWPPPARCQQQAAQLEVGPVGSASLNPMASTLFNAYLIFWVFGGYGTNSSAAGAVASVSPKLYSTISRPARTS